MKNFEYTVTEEDIGLAIKSIIRQRFEFSSRMMSKIKQRDAVLLNGVRTPGWVKPAPGDIIIIELPEENSDFEAEDIPVNVVFEDDSLLIINKQPGLVVHPTKGQPNHTMANALMKYMQDTKQSFKIRFVNRLDRDTSGLLIVAKNAYVQENLTKQMKRGQVKKRYEALLCGIIEEDQGTVDAPIGRPDPNMVERSVLPETEGGYPSITHYKVLERYPKELLLPDKSLTNGLGAHGENMGFDKEQLRERYKEMTGERIGSLQQKNLICRCSGITRVELSLETGRTHQIRIHMGHIGHHVVGDSLYGGVLGTAGVLHFEPIIERQALHAKILEFIHPITGKPMLITSDLPEDMKDVLNSIL